MTRLKNLASSFSGEKHIPTLQVRDDFGSSDEDHLESWPPLFHDQPISIRDLLQVQKSIATL
jgi:hypothetical protein